MSTAGDSFKAHGFKIELPESLPGEAPWQFETRPGGWIVVTRVTASGVERRRFFGWESKNKAGANLGGVLYHGEISQKIRGNAAAGGNVDSDLQAQFPGKVRKILVTEGADVEAGAPLVLLEAMKMEFQVKAPVAGRVVKLLVQEGQQILPGDRFVDFKVLTTVKEKKTQ